MSSPQTLFEKIWDRHVVRAAAGEPALVRELLEEGGDRLAEFAANGNTGGVRLLLDLGVPVRAPYSDGNMYMGMGQLARNGFTSSGILEFANASNNFTGTMAVSQGMLVPAVNGALGSTSAA